MAVELLDYLQTFNQIIDWCDIQRNSRKKIGIEDKAWNQTWFEDALSRTMVLTPEIGSAIQSLIDNQELIYSDFPADSFPNSPFARLHLASQRLRVNLIDETLVAANNYRDLPTEIKTTSDHGHLWISDHLKPTIPVLGLETVITLANLPQADRMAWELTTDAITKTHVLLRRTLAAKFRFNHTTTQGYNKHSVQLLDFMLVMLDTLASCTPWQMRHDRGEYIRRVNRTCNIGNLAKMGPDHFAPGKMWSDDRMEEPQIEIWVQALTDGIDPRPLPVI